MCVNAKMLHQVVAPLVGAWIEIGVDRVNLTTIVVAPLVGAWIEIDAPCNGCIGCWSLPLWERGLK